MSTNLNQIVAGIIECEEGEVDDILAGTLFSELKAQGYQPTKIDLLKVKSFIRRTKLSPLDGGMYLTTGDRGGVKPTLTFDGWFSVGKELGLKSIETTYSDEKITVPGMYTGVSGYEWVEVKILFEDGSEFNHRESLCENFIGNSLAWTGLPARSLKYRAISQVVRVKAGIFDATEVADPQTAVTPPLQIDTPAETKPVEAKTDTPAETKQVEVKVDAPAETTQVEVKVDTPAETKPVEAKTDTPAETKQVEVTADTPAETKQVEVKAETPAETKPVPTFRGDYVRVINELLDSAPFDLAPADCGRLRTVLTRCYTEGGWLQFESYLREQDKKQSTQLSKWALAVFTQFRGLVVVQNAA